MIETPDPRAARSRAAILGAAREMVMREGPGAVTLARVAERAGVGRATIYRHWPDQDSLLDEVLDEFSLPFFDDPQQPLRPWLVAQVQRLADELATPEVTRLTTTLLQRAATGDPAAVARRDRLVGTIEERLHRVLDLAGVPHDGAGLADALLGPLLYRCLLRGEPAPPGVVTSQVDALLARPGH